MIVHGPNVNPHGIGQFQIVTKPTHFLAHGNNNIIDNYRVDATQAVNIQSASLPQSMNDMGAPDI